MSSRDSGRNLTHAAVFRTVLTIAGCFACAAGASAAGTAIPHGTVELIAENQWIKTGSTANLGLRFQLEKGWHIYWVNPGDSGEPPRVKWQLPKGLSTGEMEWPAPRRLGTSSVVDFGYQDEVTLIVPMRADGNLAAQQPAQIAADLSVLVCREMCIPGKARVSLTLPIKAQAPAQDSQTEELFAATRKAMPRPAPVNWKLRVVETKDSFVLTANLGGQVAQATFYPLAESQIDNAAPQKIQPEAGGFRLTLQKSDQLLKPIDHLKGVLELSAGRAYVIDAPVSKAAAASQGGRGEGEAHPAKSSGKGQ
jgi:DsbC/DsbD-like thiol-disulfide interchange protein